MISKNWQLLRQKVFVRFVLPTAMIVVVYLLSEIKFDATLPTTKVIRKTLIDVDPPRMPRRLKGQRLPFHRVYESRKIGFSRYTETVLNPDTRRSKKILFWTPWNSVKESINYYYLRLGDRSFSQCGCPNTLCTVTRDRRLFDDSDAVIFHLLDIDVNDLPQTPRPSGQLWILYNLEPPWLARKRSSRQDMELFKDIFNLTMNYHDEADIPVKYGYTDLVADPPKITINYESIFEAKTGQVVWFVSDCHTDGGRESYVLELSKYVSVDVYGKCGTKECFPSQSSTCIERILPRYKFCLSFENAICEDYVTEKFFNVFNHHVVPVVFGGVRYGDLAPDGSYVDAMGYPDPKELAEELERISTSAELYIGMLRSKENHTAYLDPWTCRLCDSLHGEKRYGEVARKIRKWYIDDPGCSKWVKDRGFVRLTT